MIQVKRKESFTVMNERGLHTRPSSELVRCASTFQSEITLHFQGMHVNAKSLIGILMLAAAYGSEVIIEAEGEDADEAIDAIVKLSKAKFRINY